ncbi:hypothetical protein TEGL_09340 [Terrisporobacter glycolicus ATCC 14880 = DSM 1288]|uniref:Uncharacterized protein n=1 Tax=Terrisporobacter glycolicus ATCC 14880 = DSM 1288 TaxID=1121315 RepID=A0ABZ2ERM3_9FIRM
MRISVLFLSVIVILICMSIAYMLIRYTKEVLNII